MTPKLSTLEAVREAIADRLRDYAVTTDTGTVVPFDGVEVVTRQDGDILNKIETALGQTGVSIEVFIKSAKIQNDSSAAVCFDPATFGVVAYENVLVNQDVQTGTGKGAYWLIEQTLLALKLWQPLAESSVLVPAEGGPQHGRLEKAPLTIVLTQEFSMPLLITADTSN